MYIGPETLMPLASAAAALFGMLLMFWHRVVGWLKAGLRFVGRLMPGRRGPVRE